MKINLLNSDVRRLVMQVVLVSELNGELDGAALSRNVNRVLNNYPGGAAYISLETRQTN
jgi:hypothetical protein